jgi:hypothetical protein
MKIALGLITLAFTSTCLAQVPTMELNCAKSLGYKTETERQFLSRASGGGDIYNINVTFITRRPDDKLIDIALRECIAASLKLDDKKSILANAWFRPIKGANPNDDDMLIPYGSLRYISYDPRTKRISVQDLVLNNRK